MFCARSFLGVTFLGVWSEIFISSILSQMTEISSFCFLSVSLGSEVPVGISDFQISHGLVFLYLFYFYLQDTDSSTYFLLLFVCAFMNSLRELLIFSLRLF